MTYINERANYPAPINPVEPTISWGPGHNRVRANEQGLYSRHDITPEFLSDVEESLKTDPASVGLYDWQLYGQGSWKKQHGTYAAVERFVTKLHEEYKELIKEVPKQTSGVDISDLKNRIAHETGDTAWCSNALASNSSANLDHGVKNFLYEAVMGIRLIDEYGNYSLPSWHVRAGQLATTVDRQLTLGDIDQLVTEGFVAEPSNRLNLFYIPGEDWDEDPSAYEYVRGMKYDVFALEGLVRRQYGYGETEMSECGDYHGWVGQASYDTLANEIRLQAAKILFQLALVIRKSCGGMLAEAASANAAKLKIRVVAGLLDREDGVRGLDTL